jgi:hypothetical protein
LPPGSYLATVAAEPIGVRLLAGLVYAYAVVLSLWAVGRCTRERATVQRSVDRLAAHPEQAATPGFAGMASTWGRWRSRCYQRRSRIWQVAGLERVMYGAEPAP